MSSDLFFEDPERWEEVEFGAILATGVFDAKQWKLRARIEGTAARQFLSTPWFGGGSRGPLPLTGEGEQQFGHFSCLKCSLPRESRNPALRGISPGSVHGFVSAFASKVEVHLDTGTVLQAQLFDAGDERARLFLAMWSEPSDYRVLIAIDPAGRELDRDLRYPWSDAGHGTA